MSAYDEPESAFARACREEREEEARAKKPPPHDKGKRERWPGGWWSSSGPSWNDVRDIFDEAFRNSGRWNAPPQDPWGTPWSKPPPRSIVTWRTALGFAEGSRPTLAEAKASYRELIRAAHPDRGGTTEQAVALNLAWERAQTELRVAA